MYRLSKEEAILVMEAINGYFEFMEMRRTALEPFFDDVHDFFHPCGIELVSGEE